MKQNEEPQIDLCIYRELVFDKGAKNIFKTE